MKTPGLRLSGCTAAAALGGLAVRLQVLLEVGLTESTLKVTLLLLWVVAMLPLHLHLEMVLVLRR